LLQLIMKSTDSHWHLHKTSVSGTRTSRWERRSLGHMSGGVFTLTVRWPGSCC